ncbi:MAG TPA: bifunctional hydroxymethylpyrimidine kinase/phosphomethylpyrimidine kinase [Polyangiaceae bacterium]|jgi:hydroxymethylpyrimidine/phosphomethylpyrimidine kinase|nr:bifunctional hydroxymethylpyrimidine kinase/phosphomethylpyrimidine kinase [Polyangiaceae bacterium]
MRSSPPLVSCALAIGGLDPGGGAGIAADLRAFAAAGAFGCAALAVLTVQSTAGLVSARRLSSREIDAQVREVMKAQRVASMKVGALGGRDNVRAVASLLAEYARVPAVVDTPMAPTRGKGRLLAARAIAAVREDLVPRATLLTVNALEAQALLETPVRTADEARAAALALTSMGARAALVKGGHLRGADAVDVLAVGRDVIAIAAPRLAIPPTHGTGCTFASLIAGRLAVSGASPADRGVIVRAVRWAKRVHHRALAHAADAGRGLKVLVF